MEANRNTLNHLPTQLAGARKRLAQLRFPIRRIIGAVMMKPVMAIRCSQVFAVVLLVCMLVSRVDAGEFPETNGAFYAISVQNIDQSIAWYTKHLGFKLQAKGGNDVRKGALLTRPGAVLELGEFMNAVARDPDVESHEVYGIFKLGFTTAHLDDTYTFIEEAGVEVFFPIVTASDGNRTFGVKDMDGNIIQFFGK